MGTSGSFLLLKNRGFCREELERLVLPPEPSVRQETRPMAAPADADLFALLAERARCSCRQVVAYREDARWLPYFHTELCDGYICSSRDLARTSALFRTPVLSFALFDSDVLFVSFCDAAGGVYYDYAKADEPEIEEYDTEVYRTGLPAFLLSLDGADKVCRLDGLRQLKDIWDREGEVFADDRMDALLQFLGMQVIYDEDNIPEGFVRIGG